MNNPPSLKEQTALYVARLLGRKIATADDYEDAEALLSLFAIEAEKIIGKDTPDLSHADRFQNKLRARQRTALSQLMEADK